MGIISIKLIKIKIKEKKMLAKREIEIDSEK